MKRTIFLNGRRRTLRALVLGAAVALFSVPVAQANHQFGDALDRAKNDVKVIPYLSQGIVIAEGQDAIDRLMAEALNGVSPTTSVYFRADDFAPPRNVTVHAASGGVDWSETAVWLAVGLAGALGLLGLGLVANRSRVRMAHS